MQQLSEEGRQHLRHFMRMTGKKWGGKVGIDKTEQFTASPTVEQELIEAIAEQGGWFMSYFKSIFVRDLQGQKVLMSINKLTATRTDTSGTGRRAARKVHALANTGYSLNQVNNDVRIDYNDIDTWSKFGAQFPAMWNQIVKEAMANDIIRVGWYGESAAADTDPDANPNGEDLGVGWLQLMRDFETANGTGSQHYQLDTGLELGGAEFPDLDSLVWELSHQMPVHRRNNQIAYISDDLVTAAGAAYYAANASDPTQKTEIDRNFGIINRKFGNLPSVTPPYFPDGTVFIAHKDSLFYYNQRGSVRRQLKDVPESNGVEDYNSRNSGHVIYDEEDCFLGENITIVG